MHRVFTHRQSPSLVKDHEARNCYESELLRESSWVINIWKLASVNSSTLCKAIRSRICVTKPVRSRDGLAREGQLLGVSFWFASCYPSLPGDFRYYKLRRAVGQSQSH
ncbi:hypothetical protein EPI10_031167 [Gossypium australe]|uniref:Uncharacterized protein n=1 Tax=Gossypium australe TaxID=47621 RepID=A0A5B6X360_9ROSI|nr:hypothetical protein EPI10_031167 [Gossypium australe]